jgi:hypothetical protein
MSALAIHRLPTGELVFPDEPTGGLSLLPWRLLNSDFFGFLIAFVVTLTALAISGG